MSALRDRIKALVASYNDDDAAEWHDGIPTLNRTMVVRELREALALGVRQPCEGCTTPDWCRTADGPAGGDVAEPCPAFAP